LPKSTGFYLISQGFLEDDGVVTDPEAVMLFQEFPNLHIVRHHAVGVEVAEKFIGSMIGREKFVAVPKVILAKLDGDITERFEKFGRVGAKVVKIHL
jgi:hypothetical protein